VTPVVKGKELMASEKFTVPALAKPYLSIPLRTPEGYSANDASVGDLDGDGEYEIIIHLTGRAHDNSQAGPTDPPIFQAYKLNGTFLWQINLGKNIREGAHYTQFMVYDLDGDGKAEIAMKTTDGSIDGKGNVIGDSTKDWRNDRGYILSGPEYLTVFNGLTGEIINTTDYTPPRHAKLNPTTDELKAVWGDGYGNRMDRFFSLRGIFRWSASEFSNVPRLLHPYHFSRMGFSRWEIKKTLGDLIVMMRAIKNLPARVITI